MPDREFLEQIVAEYESGLLRYAWRLLNNRHEAQDAVQNAFLKLFKAMRKGKPPGAGVKCWLYRVVHNEALDIMRKETRLRNLHTKYSEHVEVEQPEQNSLDVDMDEKYKMVLDQVNLLDDKTRQVLLLRLEEGLSYKEIARVTGRTTGNVGCILHNAVKTISDNLQSLGIT